MKMKKVGILCVSLLATFMISCKSTDSETTSNQKTSQSQKAQQGQERGERKTASEIVSQMDTNKDGKLSKDETKGPLSKDFSKIDTDDDGYLTKEEIKKAPKPSGQRPQGRK